MESPAQWELGIPYCHSLSPWQPDFWSTAGTLHITIPRRSNTCNIRLCCFSQHYPDISIVVCVCGWVDRYVSVRGGCARSLQPGLTAYKTEDQSLSSNRLQLTVADIYNHSANRQRTATIFFYYSSWKYQSTNWRIVILIWSPVSCWSELRVCCTSLCTYDAKAGSGHSLRGFPSSPGSRDPLVYRS